MTIGGMTRVGKGAVVEAACVGAHVEIGAGAVVVGGWGLLWAVRCRWVGYG